MDKTIVTAVWETFFYIRDSAPIRTGNLRYNAMTYEILKTRANIYVDEKIAPYMKYTNENWNNFRPPLYGKQNPNEGWWDRAAHDAVYVLANMLGGTVTEV